MPSDPLHDVEEVAEQVLTTLRDDLFGHDGYLVVLLLTILTVVAVPINELYRAGSIVTALLLGALVLTTLTRSKVSRRLRNVGGVVVLSSVVLAVVATVTDTQAPVDGAATEGKWLLVAARGSYLIVLSLCLPAIMRRAMSTRKVTLNTMAAALAAYLLIGIIFAIAFRLVNTISGPFFAQSDVNGFTYEYFSYVTLTTTGYGDYTARIDAGRTLAMLEALLGQVFLVTIVALVVSNLGVERKQLVAPGGLGFRRGRSGGAADAASGDIGEAGDDGGPDAQGEGAAGDADRAGGTVPQGEPPGTTEAPREPSRDDPPAQ